MTELSEAVSALVDIRPVITRQDAGEAHEGGIHVESHPSLLDLLIEGTGRGNNTGSPEPGLPFDAHAHQLLLDLGDQTRDRCRAARTPFSRDNLTVTLNHWRIAFDALYGAHSIETERYFAEVDWVTDWTHRIKKKFDPDRRSESTAPCPAPNCGQRWVLSSDGDRVPAIWINWSTFTAECQACGHRWVGFVELVTLANLDAPWITLASGERVYINVTKELLANDTP